MVSPMRAVRRRWRAITRHRRCQRDGGGDVLCGGIGRPRRDGHLQAHGDGCHARAGGGAGCHARAGGGGAGEANHPSRRLARPARCPSGLFTRPPFGVAGPLSVSLFETGFPDAQVFPDSEEEPLVSQQQLAGDDYTDNIVNPGTVAVGGSVTGVIGPPRAGLNAGDRDWFKVELLAGRTYRIDLEGASTSSGTLPDPLIRGIYDAKGQKVPGTSTNTNNDGGEGRNARLLFAPDTGGTYYIAASSMIHSSIIPDSPACPQPQPQPNGSETMEGKWTLPCSPSPPAPPIYGSSTFQVEFEMDKQHRQTH